MTLTTNNNKHRGLNTAVIGIAAGVFAACSALPNSQTPLAEHYQAPSVAAQPDQQTDASETGFSSAAPPIAEPVVREPRLGDLPELLHSNELRILVNDSSSADWQRDVAVAFAVELGLNPILLEMPDAAAATELLNEGLVDLIAANVSVNHKDKQNLAFSLPVGHAREQAIVRATDETLRTPADLAGRTVSAEPGSAYWSTLERLKRSWPTIKLRAEYADFDDQLLDRVASGDIDVAVKSSHRLKQLLAHRNDVRVAFNLARNKAHAWAMRNDSNELQAALNNYLASHQLVGEPTLRSDGDWADIKQRGVLRVALRHDSHSYYLHKNQLKGFEYDLLTAFAKAHKLRMEVVIPDEDNSLLDKLIAGKADVAAGFLAKGEQGDDNVVFTRAYHEAEQRIISPLTAPIRQLEDVSGRIVTNRLHSPSWRPTARLEGRGLGFAQVPAPDDIELDDLLAGVASGAFEATVVGGPIAALPPSALHGLHVGPAIGNPVQNAWATRASNNELRQQLNLFLEKNKKGTLFYNVLWAKYFGKRGELVKLAEANRKDTTLVAHNKTGYDEIIRRYARKHGFDWRLITALVAQESGFNPNRRSKAGARGLMQMMPATARQMKVRNVQDPDEGIAAGCKYLAWQWAQLSEDIPYSSRIWFTLAAYNAGLGHVEDARKLAARKGWDANRWFGNVEKAMLLLAKPEYASKARHGYVRGGEPVHYVRSIRRRYNAYRLHDQRILNRRQLLTADAY